MEIINEEQKQELTKQIHQLIKAGFSVPPIVKALQKKFESARQLDTRALTSLVDEIVNNYQPYPLIQRAKKGKIIAPTNAKNWFILPGPQHRLQAKPRI